MPEYEIDENIIQEHLETAENLIESFKTMKTIDAANDEVYSELLKRAETQLKMAELYIDRNI